MDKSKPHRQPDGGQQPTEQQQVGRRLRTARETLGLTQDDVAGALSVPRTSVTAMESGQRNVTALELRRLARLYRRTVHWLLGEEEEAAVDNALYRATAELSEDDKEQVLRFAQFLAAAGSPPTSRKRRSAPAPLGPPPTPPTQPPGQQ
ncbi:helix-turn-helix transcriptional regulator [Streptomyces sp. NBC_01136]|uniref:helix-turn-helix domain-containing protein n=1 Tax=unclassified Streptomyces TaxID=2593676 RepID=UPI00324B3D0C|nr:helix-turn-helix transcriptional regulator [Streptomyces sp. NBC_01136]